MQWSRNRHARNSIDRVGCSSHPDKRVADNDRLIPVDQSSIDLIAFRHAVALPLVTTTSCLHYDV
jgi:hypothetical protein